MLTLTVSFDLLANRPPETVQLNSHEKLPPAAAIAARDIAAGIGANATVSDGDTTYRVVGTRARREETYS